MISGTETLGGGIEVCVSAAHTFGTDAFLLSYFAVPKRKDTACDLGCGCGIIPLLWYRDEQSSPRMALGIDLQPEAAELALQSARISGLEEKLHIKCCDLRNLPKEIPLGTFDLVTCNPPYKKVGAGVISRSHADQIARHETTCTIADVAKSAARLLRTGGRLCVCHLPERLPDVFEAMRAYRIEPKRLRFVQETAASPPWLILVEGKLGSKPFLQVERPLIMRENGRDSDELEKIYHGYRKDEAK